MPLEAATETLEEQTAALAAKVDELTSALGHVERVELTVRMPGLEEALVGIVAQAVAAAERQREATEEDVERRRIEAVRLTLEEDRQKLAWAEHTHRVREWEARQKLLEQGKPAY